MSPCLLFRFLIKSWILIFFFFFKHRWVGVAWWWVRWRGRERMVLFYTKGQLKQRGPFNCIIMEFGLNAMTLPSLMQRMQDINKYLLIPPLRWIFFTVLFQEWEWKFSHELVTDHRYIYHHGIHYFYMENLELNRLKRAFSLGEIECAVGPDDGFSIEFSKASWGWLQVIRPRFSSIEFAFIEGTVPMVVSLVHSVDLLQSNKIGPSVPPGKRRTNYQYKFGESDISNGPS